MLDSREWATVILIVGAFVICALIPRVRQFMGPSVKDLVRVSLAPKLVAVFVSLLVYVCFVVAFGWRLNIWDLGLLKDTIIITFTLGIPLVFAAVKDQSATDVFKRVMGQTLGLSVALAFYLGLATFPLWLELALQALLVVLLFLIAMPQMQEVPSCVPIGASLLVILWFIGSLAWTTVTLIQTASTVDWESTWRELLLSVWLPLAIVPFIYVLAFVMKTEVVLVRLSFCASIPLRVKVAFILGLQFRLRYAAKFDGRYNKIAEAKTFRAALKAMREFREDVERRLQEEADHKAHEVALEGVQGTDGNGAQLDRREFHVTKERLESIWIAQIGLYKENGNRHWDDRTDIAVKAAKHGLPIDHGFVTEITPDGQQWRAWRRLPIGWILGIGGGNGEPQKYFYSDDKPPTTWPLDDSVDWVPDMTRERQPDWRRWDGKFHS